MWAEIYRGATGLHVEINLAVARLASDAARFRATLPTGEFRHFADLQEVLAFVARQER